MNVLHAVEFQSVTALSAAAGRARAEVEVSKERLRAAMGTLEQARAIKSALDPENWPTAKPGGE
jgi:hypothetical protein